MKRKTKRVSRSRSVSYEFGLNGEGLDFLEEPIERILEAARGRGVVYEFDTGRGCCCWFTGKPGRELREIRDRVKELIGL